MEENPYRIIVAFLTFWAGIITVSHPFRTSQESHFINFMTGKVRTGGPAPSHCPTVKTGGYSRIRPPKL